MCTETSTDTLDLIARLVTPLMVVAGWVVVYQLQGLQARRKQLREEAEKARGAVDALQRLSIAFHTAKYSSDKRLEVLVAYNDVARRCELLGLIVQPKKLFGVMELAALPRGTDVKVRPGLYIEMKQAITLDHFDDQEQEPLAPSAEQIQRIVDAAGALTTRLDQIMMLGLD